MQHDRNIRRQHGYSQSDQRAWSTDSISATMIHYPYIYIPKSKTQHRVSTLPYSTHPPTICRTYLYDTKPPNHHNSTPHSSHPLTLAAFSSRTPIFSPNPKPFFPFFPFLSPNCSSNFLIAERLDMSSDIEALISCSAASKWRGINVRMAGKL